MARRNGAATTKPSAETPNILNVAVSRAKQSLYVVGSYGAWSEVGYARELGSSLPITNPETWLKQFESRVAAT